jgi:uncharacterized membrane protein YidH (DUF202 family)
VLQNPQRLDQFTDEIAEMRLPGAATSRERTYLRAGLALMAAGVIVGVAAYVIGHGTTNPLQQRDAIVLAVVGLTVAVVGVGLFLRYSLAQFLRFWLARLSWEQQAHTDRMVEALRRDP